VAGYVNRVIGEAETRGASAVVLQLDTPGGLSESMREIVQRILVARVPVIVYVSPPGGRAGSAGVYITYAAHVAAMAPNTNIGSATPVMMGESGESKMSDEMRAKVNNDAVAYIRHLADRHGRNADWAEKAVREGANVPVGEAVQSRIVDLSAGDLNQLLQSVNGRTVDVGGSAVTLATAGAPIEEAPMNEIERLLHIISNPTIAYILLSIGSLALIFELQNPGAILPGVAGGICLLLAFYALGTLPVNYAGLALIGFAFLLFVADFMAPTHGILTAGAIVSFLLGSLLLFNSPGSLPFFQVSLPVIFGMTTALALAFLFAVGAIARGQRRQVVTGREGMLGKVAEVRTLLDPEGLVFVESELWRARTIGVPVPVGQQVRVASVEGLLLLVEPLVSVVPALASVEGGEPASRLPA
jgi:membrane-bound serine protease (ClpP class)